MQPASLDSERSDPARYGEARPHRGDIGLAKSQTERGRPLKAAPLPRFTSCPTKSGSVAIIGFLIWEPDGPRWQSALSKGAFKVVLRNILQHWSGSLNPTSICITKSMPRMRAEKLQSRIIAEALLTASRSRGCSFQRSAPRVSGDGHLRLLDDLPGEYPTGGGMAEGVKAQGVNLPTFRPSPDRPDSMPACRRMAANCPDSPRPALPRSARVGKTWPFRWSAGIRLQPRLEIGMQADDGFSSDASALPLVKGVHLIFKVDGRPLQVCHVAEPRPGGISGKDGSRQSPSATVKSWRTCSTVKSLLPFPGCLGQLGASAVG